MENEYFYQTCLKQELERKLETNSRYSLRSFAKFIGIDSGTLSKVINGKKRITPNLSKKIIDKLELSPEDEKLFMNSVEDLYRDSDLIRKRPEVKKILESNTKSKPELSLEPEKFKMISDWYHYAILQLMREASFRYDYSWIAKELDINELEAKFAIERMIKLKILKVEGEKLIRKKPSLNAGDSKHTSSAHKKRIKQISKKSTISLEEDSIDIRNHTTITMAIDPSKIPLAKKMIDEFSDKLSEALETKAEKVYELQINLFPLQRSL